MQTTVKPFNVIDRTELPPVNVDQLPVNGDALRIDAKEYFVCGTDDLGKDGWFAVKVIPRVTRYTSGGGNLGSYFESLAVALKNMQYKSNNYFEL